LTSVNFIKKESLPNLSLHPPAGINNLNPTLVPATFAAHIMNYFQVKTKGTYRELSYDTWKLEIFAVFVI